MRPPPLRPTAVAVVVLRGAGVQARVLLLRRRGGAFDGVWNVVTGWIEAGETATDAALRELREETGMTARTLYTGERVDLFYDPVADAVQLVPIFVAVVDDAAEPALDDAHDLARWAAIDDAAATLAFAAHREAVAALPRTLLVDRPAGWRRLRPR